MAMEERTRLTVDLPKTLVERADALVRRGVARSRNASSFRRWKHT